MIGQQPQHLYHVEPCPVAWIKEFVEKWHYSHSINGLHISYCFMLVSDKNKLIGAAIFGKVAMAGAWKKYAEKESDILELRRLCCIDDTLKNTESFFVSRCLRWLKQNTKVKRIISYADNEYGHTGIIYQASNFVRVGETKKGKVIFYKGKRYHDKAIRAEYNGKLKPFAQELKDALASGTAIYKETKTKNIYIYELVRKDGGRVKF